MSTPVKAFDGAEERAIQWATRHHTTSMVQTVKRSRQPSDGTVCGMRASRKSLQSGRSTLAKPKSDRFVSVMDGDDVRPVVVVNRSDVQRRAASVGFMCHRRISGQ